MIENGTIYFQMHLLIFMSNRVPKAEKVKYAYVDVVRKQHERRQLDAFACAECEAVISNFVPLYQTQLRI